MTENKTNSSKADKIIETFKAKFDAMSSKEREEYLKAHGLQFTPNTDYSSSDEEEKIINN